MKSRYVAMPLLHLLLCYSIKVSGYLTIHSLTQYMFFNHPDGCAFLILKTENVNPTLTFITLSGELKARQAGDEIILDLPLYFTYPQVGFTWYLLSISF